MALMPKTIVGKIEFCEEHVTPWTTNAVAIGTTAGEVTAFEAKTVDARAKYQAKQAAELALKNAVNDLHLSVSSMTDAASDIIKQVRAKAATSGDAVYSLASIPVPKTPGPRPAPGLPYQLKAALKPNGSLELVWKSDNPAGTSTVYHVYRKADATGPYQYLGGSGERRFVDLTVPAGVPSVMYQIQGVRTTVVGDAAEFTVNFGTTTSGTIMATVANSSGQPTPVAA